MVTSPDLPHPGDVNDAPTADTRVVVVGQGYVGLPIAISAAAVGMRVVGLDTDSHVVDQLNAGVSHIGDVSDDALRAAQAEVTAAVGDEVGTPVIRVDGSGAPPFAAATTFR